LLKPLTYPDPSRIVLFFVSTPQGPSYGGSAAKFNIWRRQTGIFQDVAAYEYRGSNLNVTGGSFPEQIHSIRVSADYFHLLGAPIIQGRPFSMQEDRPNGGHVVVLSYGLWLQRFGGDDHVVGRTISLGGAPYNIVGVIGPSFKTELDSAPDIFLPFQIDTASTDHAQYFNVVGRLRPSVAVAAAKTQLQLAANEFHRRFPNIVGAKDGFGIELFQDAIVAEARRSLLMLSGAVIFVLLISCANVANLLFARATGRKQEMAVRTAVGAGRGRIIRQLLTESMVLSMVGGLLGLVAGWFGVKALVAINPGDIPRLGEHGSAIVMDGRLLLFTLLLSVATGVLFGLMPALDVSRADIGIALKESGGRSGRSHRQTRTRSLLIASETALAVILLIGAGLLIRSFLTLRTINRGVDTRGVLTLRMSLAGSRFTKSSEVAELVRQATRRLQDLPGVVQACASYNLPLEGLFGIPFNIVGRNSAVGQYDGRGWLTVSPGYFEIFKIPLLRGRVFTERDDLHAQPIAIINQAMARRYWPDGNPIGQRVVLGRGYGAEFEEPAREIVGVVGDVLNLAAYGSKAPEPAVYVPVAQVTDGITTLIMQASSLAWIVRTRSEPHALQPAIENALRRVTGGLVVARVRSMDDVAIQYTAGASFQTTLLSIFGGAALLLAANGLYGLMAYSLQQRTHEIGIRLALGAELGRVRNMLVFQGMRWALLGTALGIGAALGLSRLLASSLFGVSAWDPLTFFAVPAFLIAILLLAVWIPSRSATRVDPVVALRHE
jgi:putative ABC transport system permease protein